MSTASLSRFTVPVGSDLGQSQTSQGLLMPKMKYRFRVNFLNIGLTAGSVELTKQVMDFTRPTVNFEEVPLDVYNSKIYVIGKHTWETITVQLRDDVQGSVTRVVGEQVQRQFDFLNQASAAAAGDYKFITQFEILDGGNGEAQPNILETWEIVGCFIQNVNYNDMNYATNDPATISMTIRFDNATQIGAGIGNGSLTPLGDSATR